MITPQKHRIYSTRVASVYPHYVTKAEKKGRTMREIRYLDKLIDELAPGGSMEKILREP
jgi:hypothetical protein